MRTGVNLLTSLAVALAGVLGLNAGVIAHVDHDGGLALDFAHVVHAAAHDHGGPRGGYDHCGGDPEHAPLHAAMAVMAEATRGRPEPPPSVVNTIRLAQFAPAPSPQVTVADLARWLTSAATCPRPQCRGAAPPQVASLAAIMLTV